MVAQALLGHPVPAQVQVHPALVLAAPVHHIVHEVIDIVNESIIIIIIMTMDTIIPYHYYCYFVDATPMIGE